MDKLREALDGGLTNEIRVVGLVILILIAVIMLWTMFRRPLKIIWFQKRIKKLIFSLKNNNDVVTVLTVEKLIENLLSFYEQLYNVKIDNLFLTDVTDKNLISFKKDISLWYSLKWAVVLYKNNEMTLDELFLYLV